MSVEPLTDEWLLENSIKIGPFAFLPKRFVAHWKMDDATQVAVEVHASTAGPLAASVLVGSSDRRRPVTGEILRRVPVAKIVNQAARQVVHQNGTAPDGGPTVIRVDDILGANEDLRGEWPDGERLREFLEIVAVIYLVAEALGDPPTKTVAQKLGVSRATAGRFVDAARAGALLPPVSEGDLAEWAAAPFAGFWREDDDGVDQEA